MKRFLALFLAVAAPVAALAQTSAWTMDPTHAHATFTIRHMAITNVRGEFQKVAGTLKLDEKDVTKSSVEATIDAASIDTRVADRDNHLRSPDFFDVAKDPEIAFRSRKVTPAGKDRYDVLGTLTMHGVAKEITLPVAFLGLTKDPWGNDRAGFEISMTLNRKDFGIVWNKTLDTGGLMLGDDVEVTINIEATKAAAKPAK